MVTSSLAGTAADLGRIVECPRSVGDATHDKTVWVPEIPRRSWRNNLQLYLWWASDKFGSDVVANITSRNESVDQRVEFMGDCARPEHNGSACTLSPDARYVGREYYDISTLIFPSNMLVGVN